MHETAADFARRLVLRQTDEAKLIEASMSDQAMEAKKAEMLETINQLKDAIKDKDAAGAMIKVKLTEAIQLESEPPADLE